MKKILILLIAVIILVGCDSGNNSGNVGPSLPNLILDSTTGIVSWNAIDGAKYYNYIVNDNEVESTTSLSVLLDNESTISVQAVYQDSVGEWSNPITYFEDMDVYDVKEDEVYVKFHNTTLPTSKITSGAKVTRPVDPIKNNAIFENWYSDPFYTEIFDFEREIYSDTIIYANFIPYDLINNTYFWIKGSPLMSSDVMSGVSQSGWHFIPLKEVKTSSGLKEFATTVSITGASTTNPCAFLVMDGFTTDSGRTYWKNSDGSDFKITSDGIYTIYFSIESPYQNGMNVKYVKEVLEETETVRLDTPKVYIDEKNNIAKWETVGGASSYEVSIDNKPIITTKDTKIPLNKGSFITVKAVSRSNYSNWSIPQANRNRIIIDDESDTSVSVHFVGYDSYKVEKNSKVSAPNEPTKEDYIFIGWYREPACINKVNFPYTVRKNTVFYPKWEYAYSDYETKIYYNLVDESGTNIGGLTWNFDNYSFDEYETAKVFLESGVNYYIIKSSDTTVKYGPYSVDSSENYKIYFSTDNLWDGKNIYIQKATRTLYLTNNKRWTDTIYSYAYNSKTNAPMANWPGIKMTFDSKNNNGEDVYKVVVDTTLYDSIVFSHGTITSDGTYNKSSQTIDIKFSSITDNAYYVTEKDVNGNYYYGTWNK